MAEVVLINPPISTIERYGGLADVGSVLPPLGLCYIASFLERAGYSVSIIDGEVLNLSIKQVAEEVSAINPHIVGITSTTLTYSHAISVAQEIKSLDSDIEIVLGGPHISAIKSGVLMDTVDYAVYGEGEITFIDLMEHLDGKKKAEDIDGLIYKENDRIIVNHPREYIKDVDTIPYPARHLLPDLRLYVPNAQNYRRLPSTSMITSRGCPFNCYFCDHSTFGRIFRGHSPSYVVGELEEIISKYGIKDVWFTDDTFTVDKNRVLNICDEIIERGVDISWNCLGRVDNVDSAMLKKMRDAGCWMIAYGIETGNQKVMDYIKKGTTLEQVRKAVFWTKQAGLKAKGFFMLGHPIDTIETINQTINFSKSMPLDYALFLPNTPLPNTELFDICQSTGRIISPDLTKFSAWNVVYEPPNVSLNQLKEKYHEAYKSFYLRPTYILKQLLSIRGWDDIKRHIKAAKVIINF